MPSGLDLADCLGNTYQGLQDSRNPTHQLCLQQHHVAIFLGPNPASSLCFPQQVLPRAESCPHGCCHSWKHLCKRALEVWIAPASPAAHSQPGLEAPQNQWFHLRDTMQPNSIPPALDGPVYQDQAEQDKVYHGLYACVQLFP